jgi:hypothetical protein
VVKRFGGEPQISGWAQMGREGLGEGRGRRSVGRFSTKEHEGEGRCEPVGSRGASRTEIRGQELEVTSGAGGGRRSGDRSQRAEIRSQKSKVEGQRCARRSTLVAAEGRKVQSRTTEVRDQRSEDSGRWSEIGSRRRELEAPAALERARMGRPPVRACAALDARFPTPLRRRLVEDFSSPLAAAMAAEPSPLSRCSPAR